MKPPIRRYQGGTVADRIAAAIVDAGPPGPWQLRAACADTPGLMDATDPPEVFHALAVCSTCPVVHQCRSWADTETDYAGVAGGQVYTNRRRTRRTRPTTQSHAS